MLGESEECNLLVMFCKICSLNGSPLYIIDCEPHDYVKHDTLFAGAIGRAMLHRGAAIR